MRLTSRLQQDAKGEQVAAKSAKLQDISIVLKSKGKAGGERRT
jgi:hypothetical protein